jgi:hypothetical protein
MMRRAFFRLGLLVPVPLLMGAEGCKDDGSKVDPNKGRKTRDPNAAPEPWAAQDDLSNKIKVVTISAWVEREFGPYYVRMTATDHDTGEVAKPNFSEDDDPRGERVEGGQQFRFTLAYSTHHRTEIEIDAEASRPGSRKGYIATRDGRRLHRMATFNGQLKTSLTIWTER